MESAPFNQIPTPRPDREVLLERARALQQDFDDTPDAEGQIALLRAWDRGRRGVRTGRVMADIRFSIDTRDEVSVANRDFYDQLGPTLESEDVEFLRKVLASPNRPAFAATFGEHALRLWEVYLSAFDARIADDKRKESELVSRYYALTASVRVQFDGKEQNLSMLRGYFGHADRAVRRGAAHAMDAAMLNIQDQLDALYAELVALRHGMAGKLGYDSYTPMAYAKLSRTDYGPAEVERFRAEIRQHVVPLATEIRQRHARALGLDDYSWYDEQVRDSLGVPRPKGDAEWMSEQAARMFQQIGPDFATFYSTLRSRGLMDLPSRDGKAGGGFCDVLPDLNAPFVFANFNGSQDDVIVFTHECGHAFQMWSSLDQPLLDYFNPTLEACEIHSMGLEFLSYPYMELFFGDDAERFRVGHLEDAILFLPYAAAVDEFQHRIYAEPQASPQRRTELWREVESIYLPHRRYEGMPFCASGRLWQRQLHLFAEPFYYIDYALAQVCALQLGLRARQDPAGTMASYRQLCRMGGSKPFTGLLRAVGLDSPLDSGVAGRVVRAVAADLG